MSNSSTAELRRLAEITFDKDLPKLYMERPGEWVAYRGTERIGFAAQKHLMYQQCRQRNLDDEEFVVFCIEPYATEMYVGVQSD